MAGPGVGQGTVDVDHDRRCGSGPTRDVCQHLHGPARAVIDIDRAIRTHGRYEIWHRLTAAEIETRSLRERSIVGVDRDETGCRRLGNGDIE